MEWGYLCPQNKLCATGNRQTPIDIGQTVRTHQYGQLVTQYYNPKGVDEVKRSTDNDDEATIYHAKRHSVSFIYNGHSLLIDWPPGSVLSEGPFHAIHPWNLDFIQFHTPSEFTHNGFRPDMGVYLVHDSPIDNKLVVVYVPFNITDEYSDPFLRGIMAYVPTNTTAIVELPSARPDLQALANGLFDNGYLFFEGSLTTPPCTENVIWIVPNKFLPCTQDEVTAFANLLNNNIRPIQPLNNRVISIYTPTQVAPNSQLSNDVGWVVVAIVCGVLIASFTACYIKKKASEPKRPTLTEAQIRELAAQRFGARAAGMSTTV